MPIGVRSGAAEAPGLPNLEFLTLVSSRDILIL